MKKEIQKKVIINMDMYQKRKSKKGKSVNEVEDNSKMNINWYPGHMLKTY